MIVKNKTLVDFDGQPMRTPDGQTIWTVALVLLNAAVQPADNTKPPRSRDDHMMRHLLAKQIHALKDKEGADIDVPLDLMMPLRDDICRLYGSMIAGPMIAIIEGQVEALPTEKKH
jgi:hypothetical protein